MKKIKLAYFGAPSFSADFLEKLMNDHELPIELTLVVTQPDRPVGRKQVLTATPVKMLAQKRKDIKIVDSFQISSASRRIKSQIESVDLALVFAFGEIIPGALLVVPKLGFWNIHPSLLPRYRGASPIAYPLIFGDTQTGVTLIQMDEKMDHGPIIAQKTCDILPTDTRPDLEKKLTKIGFELFKEVISKKAGPATHSSHQYSSESEDTLFREAWDSADQPRGPIASEKNAYQAFRFRAAGSPPLGHPLSPQNDSVSTYTRQLHKQDGFIPLSTLQKALSGALLVEDEVPTIIKEYQSKYRKSQVAERKSSTLIYNLFRGLSPWPGIWTLTPDHRRLKIIEAGIQKDRLTIKKVQLEGKKAVDFATFNTAYRIFS